MTRQQAHALIDAGTLTWGELKAMLCDDAGDPLAVSAVNPGMTHGQALDMLSKGIDSRADADVVAGQRSRTPNMDRLTATNILRECR